MASVTTSEFVTTSSRRDAPPFSIIEQKGLVARLFEELARAAHDLSRDPRGFILDLFSSDIKDSKRRRRIYAGLACALAAHVALLVFIAYVGWHNAFVKDGEPQVEIRMIEFPPNAHTDTPDPTIPRGNRGGGGSGGEPNAAPATQGVSPKMSPMPQIVKPIAPSAPRPSLPLPPTIVGPESAPLPSNLALGVPTGEVGEAPSPGPGTDSGLGGGKGTGAGKGTGPGGGDGGGGGKGNKGQAGLPEGSEGAITGPINWNRLRELPGSAGIAWLRRPTPVTTPEAQANKVKGEVLLRATFQADGRITNIEVIRPVPYMTESAIYALEHSTFRPATVNGKPVTVFNVPVRINVTVGER